MKQLALFILLTLTAFISQASAQNLEVDSLGFETFQMPEGDTIYTMKKYFIAFLKEGPTRDQTEEEAQKIQMGHLDHINKMANDNKICMAGPFGDDGDIRGILIFNVPTMEEVQALVALDPAVISGRLELEVHSWWAAKGSQLK